MANKKTTSNKTTSKEKKSKKSDQQADTKKAQAAKKREDDVLKMIAKNDSFELTFPWQKIKPVYEQKIKQLAVNIKLKGFRKGKAPLNLAEKEIGTEKIINRVLQQLIPEAYREQIKKRNINPIADPEFQIISTNRENDWTIKAITASKPEIKLDGYKKIVAEAKKKAQKNIDEHNKKAQQQSKKSKTEKKAVQSKAKKTDDSTKQKIQPLTKQQQDDTVVQTVFSQLVAKLKPAIPELLIKQNTRQEMHNLTHKLKDMNIKMEDFLKARNMTQDQLTMQMAYSSLNQLQVEFILNAIAEEEKITVEPKEVEERIKAIEDKGVREKIKQDKAYQQYLKATIAKQKVIQYLLNM
jgi:FKBP-type peptidyl-prolyl cis-trans isomerase (trigger factor)